MIRIPALLAAVFLLVVSNAVRGQAPCVAAVSGEDLILTGSVPINNDLMPAILQWRSDWLPVRVQSKLLNVENLWFRYNRVPGASGIGGTVTAGIRFEKASFAKPVRVEVLFLDAGQDIVTSNSVSFDPAVFFISHNMISGFVQTVDPRFHVSCAIPGPHPRVRYLPDAEARWITQFRIRISPK